MACDSHLLSNWPLLENTWLFMTQRGFGTGQVIAKQSRYSHGWDRRDGRRGYAFQAAKYRWVIHNSLLYLLLTILHSYTAAKAIMQVLM